MNAKMLSRFDKIFQRFRKVTAYLILHFFLH